MKKIILAIATCIALLPATAQRQKKLSTHIEFIHQATIADRTIKNNPWGMGLGLQTMLFPAEKFRPVVELSALLYLDKIKVLYTDPADNPLPDVEGMVNLFAGVSYKPNSIFYFSVIGGPSFVSDQTLLGLKPAVGFYFSSSQKWKGQVAYLHVFKRGIEGQKQDFSSAVFSIGLRLF